MKVLLILITLLTAKTHCWAEENHEVPALSEDEVIWETEQIGGLNEVEISPLGEVFYNTKDSIVQVRSVETGELIDEILFPNTTRLDAISISADGRYMAVSGEPKYIFIYDLVQEREVKRLTALVFEQEEFGENVKYEAEKWVCSSISPDGTKVTGVAINDRGRNKSNFIVFDIESENVIYESRRLSYDMSNPSSSNYWWRSAEFTPDGKYIVSQLDYATENSHGPDSIYVHNANTLEVYHVVLNRYSKDLKYFNLHESNNIFTYKPKANSSIYIYNILSKETIETNIDPRLWSFTFLRSSDFIIYAYDSESQLYDYINDKILHKYESIGKSWSTTIDDKILISSYNHKILGINTFISKTSIENDSNEEIVISPNPTNGVVNFTLDCTEPELVYSIYSSVGAVLASDIKIQQSRDVSIDFSTSPTGVYFVSFLCNGELKTYKIIKEG